jgi:fluoride exporter
LGDRGAQMIQFLAVALGGAVGCVLRYATTLGATRILGTGFPFGTMMANLVGCLLAGLVFGLAEQRVGISPVVRLLLLTGFLGGYTTFSTFMVETVTLVQAGSWLMALGSFVANNAAGAALAVAGIYISRLI